MHTTPYLNSLWSPAGLCPGGGWGAWGRPRAPDADAAGCTRGFTYQNTRNARFAWSATVKGPLCRIMTNWRRCDKCVLIFPRAPEDFLYCLLLLCCPAAMTGRHGNQTGRW